MFIEENPYIIMSWKNESAITDGPDPEDYIYENSGDLLTIDDDENHIPLGKFESSYIDIARAINNEINIFEVLDSHSVAVSEYYHPIFGSADPEFSKHLMKLFNNDILGPNLMIINRLEILPQYRGKNLGLVILRHIISRLSSGAGIVAINPFPLQFESESISIGNEKWHNLMELDHYPKDEISATNKLCKHYSKLGFVQLPNTTKMVLSTDFMLPELADIF